jgi:hypothetical protein
MTQGDDDLWNIVHFRLLPLSEHDHDRPGSETKRAKSE